MDPVEPIPPVDIIVEPGFGFLWENKRIDSRYRYVPVDLSTVYIPSPVNVFGQRNWFNRNKWLGQVTPPDDGRQGHTDNVIDISKFWFVANQTYKYGLYYKERDCSLLDSLDDIFRLNLVDVPGTSYAVNVDITSASAERGVDSFWNGQNSWVMAVQPKSDIYDPALHEADWNKSVAPLIYVGPLPKQ